MERTPERVRAALAELRDPERRLVHELWAYTAGSSPKEEAAAGGAAPHDAPWPEAPFILGVRGKP